MSCRLYQTYSAKWYRCKFLKLASVPILYEQAIAHERGTAITSTGALATDSGAKKGRSPKDKRIVEEPSSVDDIWVMKLSKRLADTVKVGACELQNVGKLVHGQSRTRH